MRSYAASISSRGLGRNLIPAGRDRTGGEALKLLRRRAYLKVVAGRFDEAIADYDTLAHKGPEGEAGVLGRGVVLYLEGKWRAASDVFAEAKASAANLSTTDATSFVTDATKIQQDLNGASDAFQTNFTTVQKLDSKGEIGQAITSAKACKFLTG